MSLIVHQTQPCQTSCVATSFAMLTGLPIGSLSWLHKWYREEDASLSEILSRIDMPFIDKRTSERWNLDIEFVGVYLATVPSLNIKGGYHQVLIEMTDDTWIVHDPNRGNEGKWYYTAPGVEDSPLAFGLAGGYTLEVWVSAENLVAWRKSGWSPE
ncbi:hypothetical protein D3C81_442040 [compost metagenome]